MAAFELWYTVNSLLLTRKQPLEILVKSWILKFNEVEHFCHLLKMNSIRIPILENTYWWLFLYVLEALLFQNTSKWMLSSLSNRVIFYLEYFYLKNHPKNTHLHSHFHEEREFHHWFSCFYHYLLRRHSSKTFLYRRNIKILIYLKWHLQL